MKPQTTRSVMSTRMFLRMSLRDSEATEVTTLLAISSVSSICTRERWRREVRDDEVEIGEEG